MTVIANRTVRHAKGAKPLAPLAEGTKAPTPCKPSSPGTKLTMKCTRRE